MKSEQRFYIELLITTINSSGFLVHSVPKAVFISFLKLINEHQEREKQLKQKYDQTTKEYFEKNISVSGFEKKLESKLQSLHRIAENLTPITTYEFYPNESLSTTYKDLYDFYCSKTGHKREKSITVNQYGEADLITTDKKINQIAKDYLELELLKEIRDELEFASVYSSSELKIVKGVADACWELYNSNNEISATELEQRVLSEYHIKLYDDESPKETERKTKLTVKQFIRDVKKNKGIIISD